MLAFYLDHHIHGSIAAQLRQRGIDVLTAFEDGTEQLEDEELLTRATTLCRVLVTQDQDFLEIATRWQRARHPFSGIAYAPHQQTDIGGVIEYR